MRLSSVGIRTSRATCQFVVAHFSSLVVVCRNKAMQTVTNVFITNLALSDILVSDSELNYSATCLLSRSLDVLLSCSIHADLCLWTYVASRTNSLSFSSDVLGHLRYGIARRGKFQFSFIFSLCFDIDVAGYCRRSLLCYCASVSFSHAFGCLHPINHRHLDCRHIDIAAFSDLYALRSDQM